MKGLSRKLIALLLSATIVLGQVANVSAANETSGDKLNIKLSVTKQTEDQAKSLVEVLKDELSLANDLLNEDFGQEKVRVIVEVEGNPTIEDATKKGIKVSELPAADLKVQEQKLLDSQQKVVEELENFGVELDVINNMTTVINAFTTEVKVDDLEELQNRKDVVGVYYSNEYERPTMVTSLDQVVAKEAWDLGYKGAGQLLAVLDSGIDPSHRDFVMDENVELGLTKDEVNKLIASEGLPGRYYNDKVVYAYNYYDLNHNVKDIGDEQHGQHVAGTMAANGDESNGGIKGVAPDAQLLGMKVFSSDIRYSTTFSDVYVKAIDDAIKLGADGINMSLGSPAGFHLDNGLEQRIITKAQEHGVITTISAGNERNIANGWTSKSNIENPDTGLLGSPSANKAAFSIAAFENTSLQSAMAKITPEVADGILPLKDASGAPEFSTLSNPEGYEYIFVGIGKLEDFKKVETEVKGKIAVVLRGNTFTDTIANGNNFGALGVLVYNHETGGESFVSMGGGSTSKIPFAFLRRSSGLALEKAKADNENSKIVFTTDKHTVENPSANTMSTFSSWGPTPDLQLKPEITASGGNIYSTQNDDKYVTMSGTSMSSPHVSGGVGVVKEFVLEKIEEKVFPEMTEKQISEFVQLLLMNTADIKSNPKDVNDIYSPRQQGAGLMNLAKATSNFVTVVDASVEDTSYGEGKIELGEVSNNVTKKLKVTNHSNESVTLKPKVTVIAEAAMTKELFDEYVAKGYDPKLVEQALGKVGTFLEHTEKVYELELDPVTLPAKQEVTFEVPFDFSNVEENRFAEGFVSLEKDNGDVLSVPFLGFKGEWDAPRIVDTMDATNLLSNPAGADDSVRLVNSSQSSQFKSSGFIQRGLSGMLIANPNKLIISPLNSIYDQLLGIGSVTPVISQLRNAKTMEYQILDKSGNRLQTIDAQENVRKIYRLYAGLSPYKVVSGAKWDGKVKNKVVNDGQYTYRIKSIIDYPNSNYQNDDFKVVVDNTAPTFEKNVNGELEYSFDPETRVLTFKAMDTLPSGLNVDEISRLKSVIVYNEKTNKTTQLPVDSSNLLDESKDLYEYTLDLNNYIETGVNSIEIRLLDNAWNPSLENIKIGPDAVTINDNTPVNIYLLAPELLEMYGEAGLEEYKVPVKGYVFGWDEVDSITIDGKEVEFVKEEIEINSQSPVIKYKGPGFKFDTTVPFKEGYYEARLEVKALGHTDFSIARRFWVDLTVPKASEPSAFYTDTDTVEVKFDVSDNFFAIAVKRDNDLILEKDSSGEYGFAADVTATVLENVSGLKEGITPLTYEIQDKLYVVEHTVYAVRGQLNIDELVSAVKDGDSIQGTFYQPRLDALKAVVEEGRALLESGNPSQEEVDVAAKKIRDAIAALTAPASYELKNVLQELVNKADALNKDIVTDETLQPLLDALQKAKEVLANGNATDLDVYNATLELQKALDSVLYKDIAPVIEVENKEIFVGDQFDLLSLFKAKDKFGNSVDVTLSETPDISKVGEYIIKATAVADGLETSAEATLKVFSNDKSELKAKVDEAELVKLSNYTEESKLQLENALSNAKSVLANENATRLEISESLAKLTEALESLKVKSVEISNIVPTIVGSEITIGVGSRLNPNKLFRAKSPEGVSLLVEVLGEVDTTTVGVYEVAGKVTYKGASASANAVVNVVENDKTGLIAAIELAQQLDLSEYADESSAILSSALKKAQDVRLNIDATLAEIIDASRTLLDATRTLKLKDSDEKSVDPVDPVDPVKPNNPNTTVSPSNPKETKYRTRIKLVEKDLLSVHKDLAKFVDGFNYKVFDIKVVDNNNRNIVETDRPVEVIVDAAEANVTEQNKGSLQIFNNHNGELISIDNFKVSDGKVVFSSSKFSDYVFITKADKNSKSEDNKSKTNDSEVKDDAKNTDNKSDDSKNNDSKVKKLSNASVNKSSRGTSVGVNPRTGDNGIIISVIVLVVSLGVLVLVKRNKKLI